MNRFLPFGCLLVVGVFATLASADQSSYRIGAGDAIEVQVLRHPELSHSVTVLPDGVLNYPSAGSIVAVGMTGAELEAAIAKGLGSILRAPQVSAAITPFRKPKVYVQGAVRTPGPVDIASGMRVSDAIGLAGGALPDADLSQISVSASGDERQSRVIDLTRPGFDGIIQTGDTITVAEAKRVYVHGEVNAPGSFVWKQGLLARDYIGLAGGPTQQGDLAHVLLAEQAGKVAALDSMADAGGRALVAPGASIHVLPLRKVFVTGHVTTPGPVDFKDGSRLSDYIGFAGGPNPRAKMSRVMVVKAGQTGEPTSYDLARALSKGDLRLNPVLAAGDTVYVPQITFAGFRDVAGILGLVARTGVGR